MTVRLSRSKAMFDTSSLAAFRADALAAGFDEVLEREWAPDTVIDTHTHSFAVEAVVVRGEMWLTCDGRTLHLRPGERFTLAREVPHAERYGAEGAAYWVARRNRGD
jgi:mannose-6-phosphate isomerase-like protein (cupin superfamily)